MPPEPQNPHPLVSIIVLNWNGADYLPRCLEAIQAQTFQDFEVLVLDNASTDRSVDEVDIHWPTFQVIRFERNLGFAVANNRGAALARGRWLAFLNNDAFPEPNWLSHLIEAAGTNPEYAFFSSRLVYANLPDQIQSSGDIYNISGYAWPRDNHQPSGQAHLSEDEVFSPSAAAAMYLKPAFDQAGGFDERFISHHEDVDLGFRLRLLGYRCLYVPGAVVAHLVSASYGRESDRTVYQVQRNVVWSYFANMPGWLFWKYLPAHLFANLVFLGYYTLRGQSRAVWKAKMDALLSLPAVLEKRRALQRERTVEPGEIKRVLDHHWLGPFTLGRRSRKLRRLLAQNGNSGHQNSESR